MVPKAEIQLPKFLKVYVKLQGLHVAGNLDKEAAAWVNLYITAHLFSTQKRKLILY